ncbi:hypothetical protein ACFL0T_08665, partial [Candidatus Omnitrophota bacterium]
PAKPDQAPGSYLSQKTSSAGEFVKGLPRAGDRSSDQLLMLALNHLKFWDGEYTYHDQREFDRIVVEIIWRIRGARIPFIPPQIYAINANQYTPERAKIPELDPVSQVGRAKAEAVQGKPFKVVVIGDREQCDQVVSLLTSKTSEGKRLVEDNEIYTVVGILDANKPELVPYEPAEKASSAGWSGSKPGSHSKKTLYTQTSVPILFHKVVTDGWEMEFCPIPQVSEEPAFNLNMTVIPNRSSERIIDQAISSAA